MKLEKSSNIGKVISDLRRGVAQRELWFFLGWRGVRKQYSRSILGPFWLTLSMGMMVLGLGLLYSEIFQVDVATYLPKLAIGLILWGLINGLVIGSCGVFSSAASSLRQIRLPLSVHVYQFVWSQLLIFAHNFLIYLVIVLVFQIWPTWNILLFAPALLLILLNGFFLSLILGPLCARFRDVPMIISSVMQIVFFMTPIIWSADSMPQRAWLLNANPFFHFIEIVRDPLLGGTATIENWVACIAITVLTGVIAVAFFARFRARVVYWS